jgi:hypothetical protein
MIDSYSIGRKVLLSLTISALLSTFAAGFSDAAIVSSDSSSFVAAAPAGVEFALRNDIVGYSQNYLGLKYRYAGRAPETGFDCSGFTHFVMGTFGIKLSPSSSQQATQGEPVKLAETLPGDLVFFRRSARSRVSHVAMVYSNDEKGIFIIHSTNSRGIVIDNLMESAYWRPKFFKARRVINVQQSEVKAVLEAFATCDADELEVEEEIIIAPQILDERYVCVEPLPSLPFKDIRR